MRLFHRFRQGELRLSRIEAFSDGVFAIVVTLLVLEIKIPRDQNETVGQLANHLVGMLPMLLSWVISFFIVCKFWLNHHHTLGLARHADYAMIWLNALFLMCQTFIPIPTVLMGENPTNPLAVSLFGVVMAINTLIFMGLHCYIIRNLLKPELVGTNEAQLQFKRLVGPLMYLLGSTIAWFNVHSAFLLYMLTPFFFLVPSPRRTLKALHARTLGGQPVEADVVNAAGVEVES